jgi:hypothetical protein
MHTTALKRRNNQRSGIMKNMTKIAIGMLMICGAAVSATAPAAAKVSIGIGVGSAYAPPVYPACYDAYGNYVYAYPYCTAYGAPVAPYVQFGVGVDRGDHRFDRDDHRVDRNDGHGDRDQGYAMRGSDHNDHRGRS